MVSAGGVLVLLPAFVALSVDLNSTGDNKNNIIQKAISGLMLTLIPYNAFTAFTTFTY
jgi:hypothetical protein